MARKTPANWSLLKKQIETADEKTLIALIKDLFELSQGNRDFLGARYARGDAPAMLKKYKDTVSDAIYPDFINDRHARIDFARARKVVSDFKRACGDSEQILDLMIHYVEVGTQQARDICMDYESYYTSLESMFSSIVNLLTGEEKKLADKFRPRLLKIVKGASDGYGYRDSLEDMFEEAFPGK